MSNLNLSMTKVLPADTVYLEELRSRNLGGRYESLGTRELVRGSSSEVLRVLREKIAYREGQGFKFTRKAVNAPLQIEGKDARGNLVVYTVVKPWQA